MLECDIATRLYEPGWPTDPSGFCPTKIRFLASYNQTDGSINFCIECMVRSTYPEISATPNLEEGDCCGRRVGIYAKGLDVDVDVDIVKGHVYGFLWLVNFVSHVMALALVKKSKKFGGKIVADVMA